MDCDDDDLLRHNLQLAGESRSRSSSVLKPYDFPKFDFDDSRLQGHLRFDSLAETEVFLGIRSHEDSQWIEDYSRGSNGMEFNSDPVDSCSISRRDNVWSEATSSESVEMLLKSVGQEELVPAASVTLESNPCGDQDASGRQEESGAELGVRNLDITISKDEYLKDHSLSNSHVEEQFAQVGFPLFNLESIESSCAISGDLTQKFLIARGDMAFEGKYTHHSEPVCENSKELKTSDLKSIRCGDGGDSSHDTSKSSSENVALLQRSEASQLLKSDVSPESCDEDGTEQHISTGRGLEHSKTLKMIRENSSDVSTTGCTPCTVKESGVVNKVDAPSPSSMGDTELKLSKADEKILSLGTAVQIGDHDRKGLSVSYDVKSSSESCQGGSLFDGGNQHSADVGSFQAEKCASPELKADSPMQLFPREFRKIEDVQMTPCQSMTSSEKPLLPVKDSQCQMGKGDCIETTGAMELVSFDAESNQSERVEGCQNESVVIKEVHIAQLSGCAKGDSGLVIQGNIGMIADTPLCGQASFEISKQDGQLLVDSGDMLSGSKIGATLTTSLSVDDDEGVKIDDSHHELQIQTSGPREAAAELAPLPECNVVAATVSCSGFGEMRSDATCLSNPSCLCDEDAKTELSDVHPITELSIVSEVEASVAGDSAQNSPSDDFAKSEEFVGNCNEMSSNRASHAEAITSLHLDGPTVDLCYDNRSRKSSETEVATKNFEDQEYPHAAEVDKASCDSPTIISSSEPYQLEKDDREEPRASEVTHKCVEGNQPASEYVKRKDTVGDDSSFTFKVNALPETSQEPGKSWSPICDTEKCNSPIVVEESLPSGQGKVESMPSKKSPCQNTQLPDVKSAHDTPKGTSERKGRRGSVKGATKESTKKGSQAKRASQENLAGKQDKGSNILFSTPSSSPLVQFGDVQSCANIDGSKTKVTGAGVLPSSNILDSTALALSKSTSPSPGFPQPFTDLQQVQLRAQIFVYGSLIQGAAPDEACMVSAFGPSGRSSWEPIWRVAVERVQSKKSTSSGIETPLHSQSGVRASDSALKHNLHSSKGLAASVSKVSGMDSPTTIASPIIPLSSPLWCISTPSRDSLPSSVMHNGPVVGFQPPGTPLHLYRTPPIRSYIGHTTWPSQTCFPNPWLPSAQTPAFNSTVHFQPVTMTETVELTPAKDTSLPPSSAIKQVTSNSVNSAGPSPLYGGVSSQHDSKMTSSGLHPGDPKRKRKKGPATGPHHSSSLSEARTVPGVIQSVGSLQTSVDGAPAATAPAQEAVIVKPAADGVAVCSTDPPEKYSFDAGKTDSCSEETLKHVAEAKTEAEEAAGHAAAALSHSEELWGKLSKQKDSGLTTEVEAKLVSAAAAIAAAASVAKAAAAAARIAYNAALQAKLLADEASSPNKLWGEAPRGNSFADVHDIGNATPASILKGDKELNQSSSILIAAKVAAKRRVEAASAASKQAENLDAIVKAAELAAAAVSQAGRIVAMGEPLLLKDLIEAGPEGYWKLSQSPQEITDKLRELNTQHSGAIGFEEAAYVPGKAAVESSAEKDGSRKTGHGKIHQSGKLNSVVGQVRLEAGFTGDMESSPRRDGVEVGFEPDLSLRTSNVSNELDELAGTLPDGIKEGSVVEVFKCGDEKSGWYSANVLRLQDGKAYVSYCDLSSDGGSGNLCEWVCLESEGEKAPVVRIAHPSTSVLYQKTRKRRRAALGDYAWCIGDKVDVWIDDCWLEGLVTEKDEKDETTLKVHFPVLGESLNVRAWNLRTTRSWINGKWVEWSPLRAHNSLDQSDTPQEKRQKLGSPAMATKGKDKSSKDLGVAVAKPGESKLLSLSMCERTFAIGKTVKGDNKNTARRPLRSGQQKEGSRVIFGVPKPTGRMQKFVEVSKHFPTKKGEKSTAAAETVNPAKYLVPQGAGSRGWKIPSRNDSRDKRTVEARSRIPGNRKSQRTVPRRDDVGPTSGHDSDNGIAHGADIEDPLGGADSSGKGDQGFLDQAVEAPLSSLVPTSSLNAISKRTSSSNRVPERLTRGKLAPPVAKLRKVEEDKVYFANSDKVDSEVNEPRRSNRRIQPTHRLLESLQSSTIIPKMPSVAHERVQRNQNRSMLTRGK